MKKLVIFNHCGKLAVTTLENYSRRIMNAREITNCSDFESPQVIIDYFGKYYGTQKIDFIVKV